MTPDFLRRFETILSPRLIDEGKLLEAGWASLRAAAIDPNAPDIQLSEMRLAFFAGAAHVYSSIMAMLEPGEEPTDKDLARMQQIAAELEAFGKVFEARVTGRLQRGAEKPQ